MSEKPATALIFTYGTLRVGESPPKSLLAWWPDRIKAEAFFGYDYPAIVDVAKTENWITGQVQLISASEIRALDEYEETHLGIYRRIPTITERRFQVFTYEFIREPNESNSFESNRSTF